MAQQLRKYLPHDDLIAEETSTVIHENLAHYLPMNTTRNLTCKTDPVKKVGKLKSPLPNIYIHKISSVSHVLLLCFTHVNPCTVFPTQRSFLLQPFNREGHLMS
jgi:hypothetical protein